MTKKIRQIRYVMWVILVVGLIISLAAGYATHLLLSTIHQKEFENDALERFEAIQNGVQQYLNVVEDLRGLFAASHNVDRDEFAIYVRPILARQKGFQAITFNIRVSGERRRNFEGEVAREFPGFQILEHSSEGRMVAAGVRDFYIVVHYLEPLVGNERAFGFDVASDPKRLTAFTLAQDSGLVAMTSRVVLVQEPGNQFGALIAHAIYENGKDPQSMEERRETLLGFAVGVIRFGELIESAIAGLSPRGITFWLHDLSSPANESLLHHHVTRMDTASHGPGIFSWSIDHSKNWVRSFKIANRKWRFTAVHQHSAMLGVYHFVWGVVGVPLSGFILTGLSLLLLRRMLRDEKDRLTWEATLRASEEQKRIIIENAPFGIVVANEEEKILEFNVASERLFGYDRTEIIGRSVAELVPPAMREAHATGFHRYLESGEQRILGKPPFETTAMRKNGEVVPVRLAVDRVVMDDIPSFLAVIIDMTEEKRLLAELIQSEKMAGLGNMVAGMAHEINTPVGIGVTASSELEDRIQAFATLMQQEGISEEELATHIAFTGRMATLIRDNLERAANLVRSFKAVAVDQSDDMARTFKVKHCMESAVMALHHELHHTRLIVRIDCPEDLKICSYPRALSQIVINLINNSRIHGYAPNVEGRIIMKCTMVGDLLYFTYSDDGIGMSEEVAKRIFEPFVTTRRNQGGTGLGMHIVYNLVTQTLGGSITCCNSVGQGVHFLMQIPRNKVGEMREI